MTPELQQALELDRLGQDDEALHCYIAHIEQHPEDVDALVHLGTLTSRAGYFRAAITMYIKAAQLRPGDPNIHTKLGALLLSAGEVDAAQSQFEAALAADVGFAPAHIGLGGVFGLRGDPVRSRHHLDLGFKDGASTHVPYRGTGAPPRVLVLESAASGNFNPRWLLDSRRFDVVRLAVEYADLSAPLPPHDVIVNIIADADLCQGPLAIAERLIQPSDAAVVNAPAKVARTGRIDIATQLADVVGARIPRIVAIERQELLRTGRQALLERGLDFPLLLRSPGHNTGLHFVRVDRADDLQTVLASLPGDTVLAIEYVDLIGPDGLARKYRMVAVDQRLFAVHAAASRDWKIHLFSASDDPAHREEDRRFLEDSASVLSAGNMETLGAIVRTMGLDYAGVDFGIDASGRIVVFEANATMSLKLIDPGKQGDYRSPALMSIFDAFGRMVEARAGRTAPISQEAGT